LAAVAVVAVAVLPLFKLTEPLVVLVVVVV
jgi:hypothetical protein